MFRDITPRRQLPATRLFGRLPSALARAGADANLPNLITLARILSVPLALWLIFDRRYGAAFWLFVAAGISDAVDGYIAKRFDRRTRLGALLDPAADKALLSGVYISLGIMGDLPLWLVALVVLRDAAIVLGFVLIQRSDAPKHFAPLYISKINTAVQIALVGFVLARLGLRIEAGPVTWILVITTAATTVLSGFSYLARWARILRRPRP
ncbi:MAG TPA: CDP-alcohol phosphatidyltransferase family protein [Stellaceae bacterium]|nr:CDP-alcohol phosphatidyltransferase family protein [Stellaceae bacterium]